MTNTTNMVFSESTNKTGMYEAFQDATGADTIAYSAYKYARDANNALADYLLLALKSSGKWKVDDSNQVAPAEISRNIVSGTYKYLFTVDDETSANQIIEIERVECATESTANANAFQKLDPYNPMAEDIPSITTGRNISGIPRRYYIRGNYVYLDSTPNFSATGGLKIWIARTTTYFAGTDTTKVAGIPHAHQKYLVLKPAYEYCAVNVPTRAGGILLLLNQAVEEIKDYYAQRNKDERSIMTGKKILYI